MLERYKADGNDNMVKQFEKYPIAASDEAFTEYSMSSLRDTAMHELGVGTTRAMRSVMSGIFFPSLRCGAYTQAERINIWRGKAFAKESPVALGSRTFNAFEAIPELEIPIYFFGGAYDYTVNYSLQRDYYQHIKAPMKAFYTFSNSAHSPLFEEPERALNILVNDVFIKFERLIVHQLPCSIFNSNSFLDFIGASGKALPPLLWKGVRLGVGVRLELRGEPSFPLNDSRITFHVSRFTLLHPYR